MFFYSRFFKLAALLVANLVVFVGPVTHAQSYDPIANNPPVTDNGYYGGQRNVIVSSDTSSYVNLKYVAYRKFEYIYDRRVVGTELSGYFDGYYEGGLYIFSIDLGHRTVEMRINPEFTYEEAWYWMTRIGKTLGQIPRFLLSSKFEGIILHKGNYASGAGQNLVVFYADALATAYQQGFAEEVIMHELAHVSLDHLYQNQLFLDYRYYDSGFASSYAANYPNREDIAESVIPWLISRHRRDLVTRDFFVGIERKIKYRLWFFDTLGWDVTPF